MVDSSQTAQGCSFLSLPSEIRNDIYEYAASNETIFAIRPKKDLYCPSLSLVCHQIRKEYRSVYLQVAPGYATKINVHIPNFKTAGVAVRIEQFKKVCLSMHQNRFFPVQIHLDDSWSADDMQACVRTLLVFAPPEAPLVEGLPRDNIVSDGSNDWLSIHFDPRTFHAQEGHDVLSRLGTLRAGTSMRWVIWRAKLEHALDQAIARYAKQNHAKTMCAA